MYSYAFVPIIALFCYLSLMISFLAAKKNKIIYTFMEFLLIMIVWTSGSLFMRLSYWPSEYFWFQVSLCGLLLIPIGFFHFIQVYGNLEKNHFTLIWTLIIIAAMLINLKWGFFISPPEIEVHSGRNAYIYHMSWHVLLLFALEVGALVHGWMMILQGKHKNPDGLKHVQPVLLGLICLVIGHLLLILPIFTGFPIDIFSGIITAFFLFYALYARHLFELRLLISKANCYVIALLLTTAIFYQLYPTYEMFLQNTFELSDKAKFMVISITILLATLLLYYLIARFINKIFIDDETIHSEALRNFSVYVSQLLSVNEIITNLTDTILSATNANEIYVYLRNRDDEYRMFSCSKEDGLADKIFTKDDGLITALSQTRPCLILKDFRLSQEYMQLDKDTLLLLNARHIEGITPIKENERLIGFLMLSSLAKKCTYSDINFMNSITSVCSIALKNARLYEKVYEEARKDLLTGLLNRKYFHKALQDSLEKHGRDSIALVMLSVDDFKLYNLMYGDEEGDKALQKVAEAIRQNLAEYCEAARYSGKVFAIILPGYHLSSAKKLAEKISLQIQQINLNSQNLMMASLTVSCGVAAIPDSAATASELISNADMAVYHAKQSGKNTVVVYSEGEHSGDGSFISQNKDGKKDYMEYASTVYALTAAIDAKDHYTFSHSENVAYYASRLAKAYGMNDDCVNTIHLAGLFHDIGKIGIPENILNKPGQLTDEEYEIMKKHVDLSIGIIRHLPSLDYVIPAVIGHHERYDGKGYPRHMTGDGIPLMARMLCIADSFDAMVSERSYKPSLSTEKAAAILKEEAGKQFDPKLVPIFIELVENNRIEIR